MEKEGLRFREQSTFSTVERHLSTAELQNVNTFDMLSTLWDPVKKLLPFVGFPLLQRLSEVLPHGVSVCRQISPSVFSMKVNILSQGLHIN
jgi:hypothetical protein